MLLGAALVACAACNSADSARQVPAAEAATAAQKDAGVSQQAMDGVSMRYSLADGQAPSTRHSQHYEMWGNRGLWRDGWMAVSRLHPTPERARPRAADPTPLNDANWELYDHGVDPTEREDLAAQRPELLREMVNLWWAAAGQHQVLPVDDRARDKRWTAQVPLPLGADPDRTVFTGPGGPFERGAAPRINGRSFTVTAEVTIGSGVSEGVLYAVGGRHGGYAWYLTEGRLVFEVTRSALGFEQVGTDLSLAPGEHTLTLSVVEEADGAVVVTQSLDGRELGSGAVAALVQRFQVHAGRSHVGRAGDSTGSRAFQPPFAFTQQLRRVVVCPGAPGTPMAEAALVDAEMREQ